MLWKFMQVHISLRSGQEDALTVYTTKGNQIGNTKGPQRCYISIHSTTNPKVLLRNHLSSM